MGNAPSAPKVDGGDKKPGPPIASINCGSAGQGHESNDLVSLSGKSQAYSNPTAEITAENPDFASFGRSHRWSDTDFGYIVSVPVPGEYDVTLVFCETYNGNFGVGKRVFDVDVKGLTTTSYTHIDVFEQVGANKVYSINVQNVKADTQIQIDVKKGLIENPFISGLVVGAVENPVAPPPRPSIPSPESVVTQAQYDECIRNIDDYISKAKAAAPSVVREVPTFMFHEAGTKVRGLIVTFHGYSGKHYDHRILNRYLYDQGYDIFNTMLAGHMYTGHYWPATKLAEAYGGKTVPQDVFKNPELRSLLGQAQSNPALIPRLLTKLREVNPDFERVMSAQTYMNSLDQDEDPNFGSFFDSTHRLYATEGTKQLKLLDAHPGPVHVTGLSVGGSAALAVAAMNPDRITRCIAMAPLLELWEAYPNTKRSLVNYIGPLGVAKDFAWDENNPFPVSAFTATGRLGGAITSSEKYKSVFKTGKVQMFMILTEDEDAADIPTNKKFFADCGGRQAGHQFFIYPMSYAVPHPLLDPTGIFFVFLFYLCKVRNIFLNFYFFFCSFSPLAWIAKRVL